MRARRFRLRGLPAPGAKSWHVRVPGVYVRSVVADRFGLTVTAREDIAMAQGQATSALAKPLHKQRTWWSALGSIAAFAAAATPFVPDKYRPMVNAAGGVLAALAALFGRQGGVDAAREVAQDPAGAAAVARSEGLR